MKQLITIFVVLLAIPAVAQENRAAASSGGGDRGGASRGGTAAGGGAVARGGGGGGGGSSTGGGTVSSGGSQGTTATSGGHVGVGGRHAATGGSGVAVSNPAGSTSAHSGAAGTAVGRREAGTRDARTPDGGPSGVPPHARPRDGNEPITGTAVPRGSVPPPTGGGPIVVTGYPYSYPWWFGGAGYYGGYYGGYYDPWFGGYSDPQPVYGGGTFSDEGALRLKIKPREAEVYVDGYYVGVVDDFDGVFQKLHIESGSHRIEVRAAGYEPLTFDVRITPDHSTTYHGDLKKIQ